jgi:hypothetical protein
LPSTGAITAGQARSAAFWNLTGYPDELRAKFAGRRFTDLDPPDFPGTEVVLIGAGTEVGRELGLSLRPRRKTRQSAGIFTVLGMERDAHPLKPHFTGEWE